MNETMLSQLRTQPFKNLLDSCVFVRKVHSSLFGDAEIIMHKKSGIQMLMITIIHDKREQAFKLVEECKLRQQIQSQHILKLLNYNVTEVQELCGSFYRVQYVYELLTITLFDNIQSRNKRQNPFTESELISILHSIIIALQQLKQYQIRHGYIQPKHILQGNQICLTDIRFMTQMHEYQRMLLVPQQECYLAPELLSEIATGNKGMQGNEKSEVFSIGLTILHCMLLKYPNVYDFNNHKLHPQNIIDCLRQCSQKYGLTTIIQSMLSEDIYQRPSLEQVVQILSQYRPMQQQYSSNMNVAKPMAPVTDSKENIRVIDNYDCIATVKQYCTDQNPPRHHYQYQSNTPKRTSEFTPVTHISRSPINRRDQSAISDTSQIQWERQDTKREPHNDSQRFTYRQKTPDKQTRPCISPFRGSTNVNTSAISGTSQLANVPKYNMDSQSSINVSYTSYDFADNIKMNAPTSLQSEFSRLEYKLQDYSHKSNY